VKVGLLRHFLMHQWLNVQQTLALQQASEESACFLLSFFCDD